MNERRMKNNSGGYSHKYSRDRKLKSEEPDEEKLSTADEADTQMVRELRGDLDEAKNEISQLSEEVRRLRQRESSLDAENKILKS